MSVNPAPPARRPRSPSSADAAFAAIGGLALLASAFALPIPHPELAPTTRYASLPSVVRRGPIVHKAWGFEPGYGYGVNTYRRPAVALKTLEGYLGRETMARVMRTYFERWRFRHLYVDELQDLNPLQHRLLEQWRGGRPSLTAVGDPNQAIYGWNGSDPGFVERFAEHHPDSLVVAVETNYRSTAPILAVANALLDAGGLGGVRLKAFRDGGDPPRVTGYADEEIYTITITVTPANWAAGRTVFWRFYRDDSVDTQTIAALLVDLEFQYTES